MTIEQLKNENVGVLGFGLEGQAVCEYLLKQGITPRLYDSKPLAEWTKEHLAKIESMGISAITGSDYLQEASQTATVLFRSPGIKIPSNYQEDFQNNNIKITTQTQWFFEHCPAKIIGVTGTKGKGTTSSLIYEILQSAKLGNNSYLTGNIGKIQPLEFLDLLNSEDLVVYEMSSFQLQDLKQSPHIAVCLMVTSDHLDYHNDLQEYHQAKSSISSYQTESDHTIYNIDYKASQIIGELGSGKKWQISKSNTITSGAHIDESHQEIQIIGTSHDQNYLLENRLLRGLHNLENIAAATLVASILEIEPEIIKNTVLNFSGLNHRLQFVAEIAGIKYYNDSISTIPETAIAAIESFPNQSLILILGGSEKNLNYSKLVEVISKNKNIKSVITMGPVGARISPQIIAHNFSGNLLGPFTDFTSVMQAVKRTAKTGDVVLLSPAAPSFDMFTGYSYRGDEFIKQVNQING